ncbi:MAG: hypothetical protein IKE53_01470 [Clostridiales bacterium]|nr:hypothetical protein [Clostridiales bacterium]
MNIPENILSKLTDEQKAKVTSANSIEEVISIIKDFGIDLTDEQVEGLAGGTGPLNYPYLKTGPLDTTGPVKTGPLGTGPLGTGPLGTGPLGTGPLDETGPLNSCDPANGTGPLGWYDKQ